MISFCLGAGSESGDFEALVEVDGAERRPERRGSLGESGGPIVAACAIIATDPDNQEMKFGEPMGRYWHNKTLSVRRGLPFTVTPIILDTCFVVTTRL